MSHRGAIFKYAQALLFDDYLIPIQSYIEKPIPGFTQTGDNIEVHPRLSVVHKKGAVLYHESYFL